MGFDPSGYRQYGWCIGFHDIMRLERKTQVTPPAVGMASPVLLPRTIIKCRIDKYWSQLHNYYLREWTGLLDTCRGWEGSSLHQQHLTASWPMNMTLNARISSQSDYTGENEAEFQETAIRIARPATWVAGWRKGEGCAFINQKLCQVTTSVHLS